LSVAPFSIVSIREPVVQTPAMLVAQLGGLAADSNISGYRRLAEELVRLAYELVDQAESELAAV
jgi:hypothetical protein